eukprot:8690009-Pyramimonas_sp.AAC.1
MDEDDEEEIEIPAMPVAPEDLKRHVQDLKGEQGDQAKAFLEQLTAASAKLPFTKLKVKKAKPKWATSADHRGRPAAGTHGAARPGPGGDRRSRSCPRERGGARDS